MSEPHLTLQKFPVRNGIKERPGKTCVVEEAARLGNRERNRNMWELKSSRAEISI